MRSNAAILAFVTALALGGCNSQLTSKDAKGPGLIHNVYFELNDNSQAARAKLVAGCYTYLRDHPGVTFFAAGEIVESHVREVNVRDWDVGLHIVFKSMEAHDLYQKAPAHLKFIEENKTNWKSVRVFDTYIR